MQLAMRFLRFPPVMMNTLLWDWDAYMKSPAYLEKKRRAGLYRETTPEATQEKERQKKLKNKTNALRDTMRRTRGICHKSGSGLLSHKQERDVFQYKSDTFRMTM